MKICHFFLSAVLCFSAVECTSVHAVEPPDVSAKAAAVISADTCEVVWEKNGSQKLPMASTTKIMSALLCIESGGLDEPFTVDSKAIHVEGSSMGLREGDTVTKYALCCGMLLPSGNDAANAAAVRIAGSTERFAEMMNDRAREMGLSHTWFVTPSGLEGEGHGSSACDMAVLAAEALKNDTFRSICSSETIQTEFGAPPYKRWLKNTNKLLSLYSGTYGVKTGFTDEAGRCLVSACEREGKRLICVTLNDPNDWNDHMALFDYGFGQVETIRAVPPEVLEIPLAGGEKERLSLKAEEDINFTSAGAESDDLSYQVLSAPFVYAPVSEGENVAQLSVSLSGRELKRIPLYAAEDAPAAVLPEKQGIIDKLKKILGL
ncbi:D-alanyl-D-alanine carboxypeptidase family protein [Ruminococcus sp. XPD3002]|uniref:D-alanyl-D-alanine carboxypeptidase family protein n=1 Tax=Ruminococcus sp. XPD3002 TaxID=1452269 RepID=UPI00090FB87D|nr:D-alanyl-D-alanine carboxypeptidase (penicillin-binding protein 5/6) [Ruminococcus flavefaciens]